MFMPLYPLAREEMTNNTQEGCGAARQRQVRWGLSLWETLASSARRWGRISAYPTTSLTTSSSLLLLLLLLLRHVHSIWVHLSAHARRHALSCEVGGLHHSRTSEARGCNWGGVAVSIHARLKAVHLGIELSLAGEKLLILELLLIVHSWHVGHVHGPTWSHGVLIETIRVHTGSALQSNWVESGSRSSVKTSGIDLRAISGRRSGCRRVAVARSATRGQAYFVHKSLVALLRLSLDAYENIAHILHDLCSNLLIEKWGGQHLEDKGSATVLVRQDFFQYLVVG